MSRGLLINPSYLRTYGSNEGGLAFPVYPVLGLASLAGAALEAGHDCSIIDLSHEPYEPGRIRQAIRDLRPDVVGITATTPLVNQLRDMSFLIKDVDPSILVVGGGAHPSALPHETLRQSALDAVAVGEADRIISDVLSRGSVVGIPGLVTSGSGPEWARGPLIENLDDLPMPAWQVYPRDSQQRITKLAARHKPVTTVEFSRGCIYNCDFCGSKNTMGRGYRKKSPERCAEEMTRLASLGFKEAVLVDDIFTSDNDWAAAVCEALIRAGSPLAWSCTNGIRVDSANAELFGLMKRAGCYRVYFGLESGNDEILRAFGKGGQATLDAAGSAVKAARKAKLEPNGFFLVGLTGDTESSMDDTINFAKGLELDSSKCGMCVPFPGTPMFHELNDHGRIRTLDWDAYTVYNDAEAIFDHPTLPWATIKAAFDRFYREVYFRNPRMVLRRLAYMLRTGELVYNVYYTVKFALMLWGPRRRPEAERYEYEDRWRPSDLQAGTDLRAPTVQKAKKGAGATGSDGRVTITTRNR